MARAENARLAAPLWLQLDERRGDLHSGEEGEKSYERKSTDEEGRREEEEPKEIIFSVLLQKA